MNDLDTLTPEISNLVNIFEKTLTAKPPRGNAIYIVLRRNAKLLDAILILTMFMPFILKGKKLGASGKIA